MFTYLYKKTDNAWNLKYWRLRGAFTKLYICGITKIYDWVHTWQILCIMCHFETISGGGVIIALIFKYGFKPKCSLFFSVLFYMWHFKLAFFTTSCRPFSRLVLELTNISETITASGRVPSIYSSSTGLGQGPG